MILIKLLIQKSLQLETKTSIWLAKNSCLKFFFSVKKKQNKAELTHLNANKKKCEQKNFLSKLKHINF